MTARCRPVIQVAQSLCTTTNINSVATLLFYQMSAVERPEVTLNYAQCVYRHFYRDPKCHDTYDCHLPMADTLGKDLKQIPETVPGRLIECLHPCCNRTTGDISTVGELLMRFVSVRMETSAVVFRDHEFPPVTRPIQSPPVNLIKLRMFNYYFFGP